MAVAASPHLVKLEFPCQKRCRFLAEKHNQSHSTHLTFAVMTSRYIVQYGGAIKLDLSSTKLLQGASSDEKDDIFAYDLNSRRQTTFYKKKV